MQSHPDKNIGSAKNLIDDCHSLDNCLFQGFSQISPLNGKLEKKTGSLLATDRSKAVVLV